MSELVFFEKPFGVWSVPKNHFESYRRLYEGETFQGVFNHEPLDEHVVDQHIYQPQVLKILGITFDAGLAYFHGLSLPNSIQALDRILGSLHTGDLEGTADGSMIIRRYPNFNYVPKGHGKRAHIPEDEKFSDFVARTDYENSAANALKSLVDYGLATTTELSETATNAVSNLKIQHYNEVEDFFARYYLTKIA